jgi:leucyl aminopeptidase (aminopeptidase T)
LGAFQDAMYDAAAKAGARTVQMAIGRISDASARMYGVDSAVWRRELIDGTLVPPRVLHRRARPLVARLEQGHELEIEHPNGTHLSLRLRNRKVHVADGTVARAPPGGDWNLVTLPAGVVTVAVDESFAEGSFRSNVRCSTGLSDSVGEFGGGRWTFDRGRMVRYAYDEGQDLFAQSYARAREGRDRPAAVSIGLNERISTAPLLEDQSLGTVSMHIGRNDHLGGRTRVPWWAWLFLRNATVSVDGEPIVRAGRLVP